MPGGLAVVAFYVLAAMLVGASLAVVMLRNIVHAALFLIVVFAGATGLFVLLNAEFLAIIQVLIYAGAVTILILFAIMLTQQSMGRNSNPFSGQWWLAALICVLLAGGLIYAVTASAMAVGTPQSSVNMASAGGASGTIVRVGQLLYSPVSYSFVLRFEIASVVILVAIVGAIMIGREE